MPNPDYSNAGENRGISEKFRKDVEKSIPDYIATEEYVVDAIAAAAVTPPTGTGFRHMTAGGEDAASKLAEPADIDINASLEFNQNQALQFVIENRTSDPGAPVSGQMWLRTDI